MEYMRYSMRSERAVGRQAAGGALAKEPLAVRAVRQPLGLA